MNEKERKKRVQNIIVSACVILLIFVLIGLGYNIVRLVSINSRIAKTEAQIEALNQKISAYDAELAYWEDKENIIKYLREYEEMKKTDEIAFIGK